MLIKIIVVIFAVLVGITGFIGFSLANPGSVMWNLYSTLRLYGLNTDLDLEKMNVYIEIARWLAPFITGGVVLLSFQCMKLMVFKCKGLLKQTTVIYGTSVEAEMLQSKIPGSFLEKNKKLHSNRKPVKQIVFLDTDEENINFFIHLKKKLKAADKAYILINSISRDSIEDSRVTVFNMAEICARLYWSEFMLTKSEKIAIIGFSNLGQAILNFGINKNLFSLNQHVEYFIYGDFREYTASHINDFSKFLKPDSISFKENWLNDFELMKDFDRIILAGENHENLLVLDKLLLLTPFKKVHIKTSSKELFKIMYNNCKIIPFGTAEELCLSELILQEKLIKDAKTSHENYALSNQSTPSWENLDCFTRYSNVALYDHKEVKEFLFKNGVSIEEISELEHIRWCRYHFLNNWKHGEIRNNELRIHPLLIPFSELDEKEKNKNYEKVREIISI